jgi:hypothetical protein
MNDRLFIPFNRLDKNMTIVFKAFQYTHPECQEDEVYLGNFTYSEAMNISWKTKRAGVQSYKADGTEFPYQEYHGVKPYFVEIEEVMKYNNGELLIEI